MRSSANSNRIRQHSEWHSVTSRNSHLPPSTPHILRPFTHQPSLLYNITVSYMYILYGLVMTEKKWKREKEMGEPEYGVLMKDFWGLDRHAKNTHDWICKWKNQEK